MFISGPMTGFEDWNFPAFYAAETKLAASGYKVINPARELSDLKPGEMSWEECMRIAMRRLADARTLFVLPFWQHSKGAALEVYLAKRLGIKVIDADTGAELTSVEFELSLRTGDIHGKNP